MSIIAQIFIDSKSNSYQNGFEVIKIKKYIIEMEDDLATIFEDIARINHKETEEALQIILKRVIETMLNNRNHIDTTT